MSDECFWSNVLGRCLKRHCYAIGPCANYSEDDERDPADREPEETPIGDPPE